MNWQRITGAASIIKCKFLSLKLSIFRYHSTRFVSYFLSLFGIEVDDPSASPKDTVPRIFHMVKLQQCYRFRAPVFSAIVGVEGRLIA